MRNLCLLAFALLSTVLSGCTLPDPAHPKAGSTPAPVREFNPSADRWERTAPYGQRFNR